MDVGIFILVRDRGFRPSSQLSGGMAVAVGDYVLLKPLSGPVKVVQVLTPGLAFSAWYTRWQQGTVGFTAHRLFATRSSR